MGGLILGVNTLYRIFCVFKLFPMVGKGLIENGMKWLITLLKMVHYCSTRVCYYWDMSVK